MSSTASRVARASGRKKRTSTHIGVDGASKQSVFYARMAKKKGAGGASRRGSHWMSDAGGCEVRWFWGHHIGLKPTKGNFYMDFGTLGHSALAYFYAQKMGRKPGWFLEQPHVDVALQDDSQGNPQWVRAMNDIMENYRRFEAGDPWNPLFIEEEFEATIGDLDPDGQDEAAEDIEYEGQCDDLACQKLNDEGQHVSHLVKKSWHFSTLNEEVVTCRPDLIIEKNGRNWIIDHKFQGGGKKDRDRLPIIDDRYPDYTYYWQAMVNLHIVRKGRCADAPGIAEQMPIQGFMFNRVKRDIPYDISRDLFSMPARQYAKVPTTMRATISRSRVLKRKALLAPKSLIAHPWECEGKWKCDYVRVCHTSSLEERDQIINTEFFKP